MAFSSDNSLLANQLPISIDFPNPDDKQFNGTLSLTYKRIADSMNTKEGSLYTLTEIANFRKFYKVNNPQETRNSYRKVFDLVNLNGGNIAPGALAPIAHNITGIFETDLIYASCKSTDASPIYFTVVYPDIYLDGTNIYFTNPLGVALQQAIVVANYLKIEAFMSFLPVLAAVLPSLLQAGSSMMSGGGDQMKKIATMDKGQQQIFNQLKQFLGGQGGASGGGLQTALQQLMGMLDPNSDQYKNFEQPYLTEFNEQTLPGIAERFAGAGALSSSGFGQALGGAASQYKSNLAGQKQQMMQNALAEILGLTQNTLGQQPFDYLQKQGGTGFGANALSGLGNISSSSWKDMFSGLSGGGGGISPQNSQLLSMASQIHG